MLLRRVLLHFNKQDWIAIFLDFVIVVVGIFVGLQVDGWNQDRKDRIRERANLEQLYADFGASFEQASFMAKFHADKADDLEFAMNTIARGALPAEDTQRFNAAWVSMFQLPSLSATMGAYDSMIASGDFALIRDPELKSLLVLLAANLNAEESLMDYFRASNAVDRLAVQGKMLIVPNAERTGTEMVVDFAGIVSDPMSLTVVASQRRDHQVFQEFRQNLADEFLAAQAHVAALLGQAQAP